MAHHRSLPSASGPSALLPAPLSGSASRFPTFACSARNSPKWLRGAHQDAGNHRTRRLLETRKRRSPLMRRPANHWRNRKSTSVVSIGRRLRPATDVETTSSVLWFAAI